MSCAARVEEVIMTVESNSVTEASRAFHRARHGFVKFFGASDNRLAQSHNIIDEINRAGCHWACTYPESKRPRRVEDGDVIFMARLVSEPDDMRVFGRALAMEHRPGRDDATAEDIRLRPWKSRWPCYIRVHDAEFVDGTMRNGVSLNQMMDELGADAWASTSQRATQTGMKDIDPRASLRQQSQLQLTPNSLRWLSEHLEQRFNADGKVSQEELAKLDWPATPSRNQTGL